MTYSIRWLEQDHVLLVTYQGDVFVREVEECNTKTNQMMDEAHDRNPFNFVHTIMDVRQRGELDRSLMNLNRLGKIINADGKSRPYFGWFIVVDSNPNVVMKFLAVTLTQMFKVRFRVFEDLKPALEFLKSMDAQLTFDLNNALSETEKS
jgi:hypothetical protein